jgi:hypothetical protein
MPEYVEAGFVTYMASHWEVGIWILLFYIASDTLKRKTYLSWSILFPAAGILTTIIFYAGCKIINPELWDRFVDFWTLGGKIG